MRYYYTLIVKEKDSNWSPQFGDYDKEVVEQELEDTKKDYTKGSKFRIIKTGDKQKEIDKKVEEINEKEK